MGTDSQVRRDRLFIMGSQGQAIYGSQGQAIYLAFSRLISIFLEFSKCIKGIHIYYKRSSSIFSSLSFVKFDPFVVQILTSRSNPAATLPL